MGTSSEDVLLMVGNVRYKKNNGTLYLMAERIAWMLEGKDTFPVSHKYADVKSEFQRFCAPSTIRSFRHILLADVR